ncbi:MAG: DUF362 domain-containing protein [Clostridia bacterium]|nr:DUF362 domain-containing protein [Clostridia bacterium]
MDENIQIKRPSVFDDRRAWVSACDTYDSEKVYSVIEQQAEAMGLDKIISPGCTVVLKPNLVIKRKPEEASTTHPEVVGAVIRAVKKRGAGKVIIAESGGGLYNKAVMSASYNTCGITDVCKREGAELNFDFSDKLIKHPDALLCHQFNIITPVIDADVLINIAKLKTHSMTGYSGAVKNLFGCVPGLMKPELHCQYPDRSQFQQMIVDLNTLLKPSAVFIDAIDCMEGDGPTGGSPRHVGAVVAAYNPFAADIAASRMIAVDPSKIYMLSHGMEQGLSPNDLSEVELYGDPEALRVADFVQPKTKSIDFLDRVPAFLRPIARVGERLIAPRPVINRKKCIGCGKCSESCPQHTIIFDKSKKAQIIKKDCIKCYCCHEMCPIRAIDIKRQSIFKL